MADEVATPDGILREDWDRVHELALEVVNASCRGEEAESDGFARDLLQLLTDLEARYGPLPSILATRADYVQDRLQSEQLLHAAYELAVARRDERNLVWISSSLASLYIEEFADREHGNEWLMTLEKHLATYPDEGEQQELERLRARPDEER